MNVSMLKSFQSYAAIKHRSSITDGPRHILDEVKAIRSTCTKTERDIALKSVNNNCYFAHPEAVLLGMLGIVILSVILHYRSSSHFIR